MSPAQQNNRPSSASANNSRNRLSLGSKPISLREIRSSSVGTNSGPSINSKESNTTVNIYTLKKLFIRRLID